MSQLETELELAPPPREGWQEIIQTNAKFALLSISIE
jgi:hypothetical protein